MLQVFAVGVTDQNHLLHQLPVRRGLWDDLPKDQQQLLYRVILWRGMSGVIVKCVRVRACVGAFVCHCVSVRVCECTCM